MTTVYRIRAIWQGFQGAPGYTNFHFQDLTTDVAKNAAGSAVRAYFFAMNGFMLAAWNVQVQAEVQEFDMATGILTAASNMTTVPPVVNGIATPVAFAGGSGFVTTWKTPLIFMGRRVNGRTFHVPAVGVFDNDGTLTSAALASIGTAANTLITQTGAELAIWARTWDKLSPPTQIGGALPPVTSYIIKDSASQLRSRRN